MSAADNYRARFRKVLDHIDANLEGDLSLSRLSGVAAFSMHHFHRQFSALFGIGVHKYVQLARFKRASFRLAFRRCPVVDVALASGYEGPEAFARAFRKVVGQSPTEFRKAPRWNPWYATYQPLSELRREYMPSEITVEQVKIVQTEAIEVAVFEHRGDPRLIGDSVRRFIDWRREHRLHPSVSATYNILYDNPVEVAPEDYRLDLCAAVTGAVADNPHGVVRKTIPGGRCAVLRHVGSDDTLARSIRFLYAEWLPQSGEEPRDFPIYVQRVSFFPDVAEGEAVVDVFLPLT